MAAVDQALEQGIAGASQAATAASLIFQIVFLQKSLDENLAHNP
jgi:hypothetical protein